MRAIMALPLAFVALAALSCTSASPDAVQPAGEVNATILAIIPAGAAEGPALSPVELRLTATPPDSRPPLTLVVPVSALTARGELRLERHRAAERWRLRGAAAVGGDTIFRVVTDLEARVDSPRPTVPLRFLYDGRDVALARLVIEPRDTTLDGGATFTTRVRGEDPLGGTLLPPLGWRSRATSVATVDAAGRVSAVATGSAWIVGRSWTGLADSVRVVVR